MVRKAIIYEVKTSILHQFTELKPSDRYFIRDRISYGRLSIGSKFILVQRNGCTVPVDNPQLHSTPE